MKTILEFELLPFKKFIEKLRLQTNDTLCGLVGDALSIYFFKKNNNNKGMRQAIHLTVLKWFGRINWPFNFLFQYFFLILHCLIRLFLNEFI